MNIKVPIIRLSEDEKEDYLDEGYNPPDEFSADFEAEWKQNRAILISEVGRCWEHGVGREFLVLATVERDRMLCIEVTSRNMMTQKLLNLVQNTVLNYDEPYSVHICAAIPVLREANGGEHSDFSVFVEPERVLVYAEHPSTLTKFGIEHSE